MGEQRCILNLGTVGMSGPIYALAALPLGKDCSGPIERAVGWDPEPARLLQRGEKALTSFGYQIMILQYLGQQNAPSIIIA